MVVIEMEIFISALSEEEKKKFDVAKALSDKNNWREFFLELIEEKYGDDLP